jgi:hypothetical protein
MLQAGRSRVLVPMRSLNLLNLPNPLRPHGPGEADNLKSIRYACSTRPHVPRPPIVSWTRRSGTVLMRAEIAQSV